MTTILTCTDFKQEEPSRHNAELQEARVAELVAMGCVVEGGEQGDCIGTKHGEQLTCWDFCDELSLYSDGHWEARLEEYSRALTA